MIGNNPEGIRLLCGAGCKLPGANIFGFKAEAAACHHASMMALEELLIAYRARGQACDVRQMLYGLVTKLVERIVELRADVNQPLDAYRNLGTRPSSLSAKSPVPQWQSHKGHEKCLPFTRCTAPGNGSAHIAVGGCCSPGGGCRPSGADRCRKLRGDAVPQARAVRNPIDPKLLWSSNSQLGQKQKSCVQADRSRLLFVPRAAKPCDASFHYECRKTRNPKLCAW